VIVPAGKFRLIRGKQCSFDHTERYECQHKDDEKEHDTSMLETFSSNNLDAIKQPVGCQVEYCSNKRVVDDFQDYSRNCAGIPII